MTNHPILTNPPITEALLDIQVNLPKDFKIDLFKSVGKELSDQFPKEEVRKRIETTDDLKNGEHTYKRIEKIDGYRYVSNDKTKIVQLRLDGFTYNKLKPYTNWEEFRDDARTQWEKYINLVKPDLIHRVALRYINNLNTPFAEKGLGEFLQAPPVVPEGVPKNYSSFLNRIVVHDDSGAIANITLALDKIIENITTIPILLDIDVYKIKKDGFNEEEIWETLEVLRRFKNVIFFSSITDKLREVYQ